jgi:ABC-type long-subunit fatty acid transport system fused permease/ATPase subunit
LSENKSLFFQNMIVWALACVGWIFVIVELLDAWDNAADIGAAGIAPPVSVMLYALYQVAFYGALVIAFPLTLGMMTSDLLKAKTP